MNTATEYCGLPLNQLTESNTNPRRIFEDSPLRELAESIRTQVPARPRLLASKHISKGPTARDHGRSFLCSLICEIIVVSQDPQSA